MLSTRTAFKAPHLLPVVPRPHSLIASNLNCNFEIMSDESKLALQGLPPVSVPLNCVAWSRDGRELAVAVSVRSSTVFDLSNTTPPPPQPPPHNSPTHQLINSSTRQLINSPTSQRTHPLSNRARPRILSSLI